MQQSLNPIFHVELSIFQSLECHNFTYAFNACHSSFLSAPIQNIGYQRKALWHFIRTTFLNVFPQSVLMPFNAKSATNPGLWNAFCKPLKLSRLQTTLRNGPFCILKRPVLECRTGRFESQNGQNSTFVAHTDKDHQHQTKSIRSVYDMADYASECGQQQ